MQVPIRDMTGETVEEIELRDEAMWKSKLALPYCLVAFLLSRSGDDKDKK